MENDSNQNEKELQDLRSRVAELERQLAEAQANELDGARLTEVLEHLPVGIRIAEEQRRLAEERYARLFNSLREGFAHYKAIYDDQGRIVDILVVEINPAGAKISGIAREKQVGKTWRQVWSSLDEEMINRFQRADETGGVVRFDDSHWRTDRTYEVIVSRIAPGEFIVTSNDITERKQAEEALAESERRQREITRLLELDQARLAAILQNLPVGIWIADQTGRLTGSNEQADRIWAGETPLLNSLAEYDKFKMSQPETGMPLKLDEYPVAVALHTGQPVEPVELEIERFDGSKGTVLASAAPIKDRQGQLTGAVGVNVDISDRKLAEEKLRAARDEATWLARFPGENPNPVIRVSEAGTVLYRNPPAASLPGWVCEIDEPLPAALLDLVQQAMAQHHVVRQDVLLGERYYLVFVMPIPGEKYANVYGSDITDRKQAEEALRNSEERFVKAFHASPDAIVISRVTDGLLLEVNEGWTTLFGHEPAEVVGHTSIEMGIWTDPNDRTEALRRLQRDGSLRNFELEVRRKSGEIRQVSMSMEKLQLAGVDCILTTLRDITDRKRAQANMAYQSMLLESVNDAIVGSDAEFRVTAWNAVAEFMYGWKAEEVLGRNGIELLETQWPRVDALTMRNKITETGRWRGESTQLRKDGTRIPVEVSSVVLHNEQGQVTGYVSVNREITERKRVEQALLESERRFHSLADSMPQLVWTALPDGTVDYYNQRYQEYRDIKHTDGDTWEWAPVLHPDDLQSTVDAWQHAVKTGEIYEMEHRVRMADGSYRWHLSRGVPMLDEHGQVIRWFGTATDIHELKTAEEKLVVYAERLERSSRE